MAKDDDTPKFTTPPNALKGKVGEGGIPAYILKRCQEYLESNPVDFTPYASRHLEHLKDLKSQIERKAIDDETARRNLVNIVMQLKSNGSMFHYQLISMISDVMLRYMENVSELTTDFIEIFGMYIRILGIILNKRLNGNGGREGYALTHELNNACLRYQARHRPRT